MNIKNNKNCKITINDRGIEKYMIKPIKADEMFKKLGYEKVENEQNIIFEKGVSTRNRIIFARFKKTVSCIFIDEDYEWNDSLDITMEELQAINKKCQELGWI